MSIGTEAKSLLSLHLVAALASFFCLGGAALFSHSYDRVAILAGVAFAAIAYLTKKAA